MTSDHLRASRGQRLACAVLLSVALGVGGCASPSSAGGDTSATAQTSAADAMPVIQHEVPRRDFVGPAPAEFRWSPIQGADRYGIGLWNETDRLLWRKDDITGPSVTVPKELYLEYGTYFWSVSALRNDREIAKSGMAAFVIEE